METSTINQLIQTIGVIAVPVIAISISFVLGKKFIRFKKGIDRESMLLHDILYFREVIRLYEENNKQLEDKSNIRKFRELAKEGLGYKSSTLSEPAKIKQRLQGLGEINDKISKAIALLSK